MSHSETSTPRVLVPTDVFQAALNYIRHVGANHVMHGKPHPQQWIVDGLELAAANQSDEDLSETKPIPRRCPKCGEPWTEFMEWYDGPHCPNAAPQVTGCASTGTRSAEVDSSEVHGLESATSVKSPSAEPAAAAPNEIPGTKQMICELPGGGVVSQAVPSDKQETPRTAALLYRKGGVTYAQLIDHAEELERELAMMQGRMLDAEHGPVRIVEVSTQVEREALALLRELNDALVIPGWLQARVDALLDRAEEKT